MVWTVGILDKGGLGRTPPSASIRVHRRVRNSGSGSLAFERLDASDYAAGGSRRVDTLLVVRDAVPADQAPDLLARVEDQGSRLVVDLDDDLLSDAARVRLVEQGYQRKQLEALGLVVAGADEVLVSTDRVHALVADIATAGVTVVPNELDPLLWFAPRPSEPDMDVAPDEVRLLYMGSKTHQGDLDLLAGLPERLAAHLGRPVVIEVVGVTASDLPPGTRRLVPLKTHYPGFVGWLRRNSRRWAVGLAPLADETFNLAKSDLKLLEYAALGLPVVASPVGPYAMDGAPPLAVSAGTPEEWVEAVALAVAGGDVALEVVRRQRTMTPASIGAWQRRVTG